LSGDVGLTRVSLGDLEALRGHVATGRIGCPLTRTGLQAQDLGHLERDVAMLAPLDQAATLVVLDTVISERRLRPVPLVELVWTGPEARFAEARDTRVVVRRLFAQAERSVLLGGYSFVKGADIFEPLYEAMRDRNVDVTIVIDIPGQAKSEADADSFASQAIERFYRDTWPFGDPKPTVYYDPRTVLPRNFVSLHAKCVVVDTRFTLVTSANFTDRGHTWNIEAGVLVEDTVFARRFAGQWRGLIDAGLAKRYGG